MNAQNEITVLMGTVKRIFDARAISRLINNIKFEFFEQDAANYLENKIIIRIDFYMACKLHAVYFRVSKTMVEDTDGFLFYVGNRGIDLMNKYVKNYFLKQLLAVKRLKQNYANKRNNFRKGFRGRINKVNKTKRRLGA